MKNTLLTLWTALSTVVASYGQSQDSLLQALWYQNFDSRITNCIHTLAPQIDTIQDWIYRWRHDDQQVIVDSGEDDEDIVVLGDSERNLYLYTYGDRGKVEAQNKVERVRGEAEAFIEMSKYVCEQLQSILWIQRM